MAVKTLIIGCGYTGLPLAQELQRRGHEITAWVRSPGSAEALAPHGFTRIITGSVGEARAWESVDRDYGLAIHGASSGRGGPEAYTEVFLRGVRCLNEHLPSARRIFVSSTSVYGQTDGEIVTEDSRTEPATETGRILREAEAAALAAGAIVVRPSGIYGPGRGVLFEKFRRGEAVLEGDGNRWLNMIHRDDLVAALAHIAVRGEPGNVYNASDGTPVTLREFYEWCSEVLKKPMPPRGEANPNRKRGLTSKRVSHAKLRASGWAPVYPSFREGLAGQV